jgi:hypothetical protein
MLEYSHSIVNSEASFFVSTVSSEYGKANLVVLSVLQWVSRLESINDGSDMSI